MSIHNPERLYRICVDLVVLLILNGNNYLLKLRGLSGFDGLLFHYVNVWINYWTKRIAISSTPDDKSYTSMHDELYRVTDEPFLFDPHTFSLNLPPFFNSLFADTRLKTSIFSNSFNNTNLEDEFNDAAESNELGKKANLSPICVLYQLSNFGIVPKPATFNLLPYEDYVVEQDDPDEDDHDERTDAIRSTTPSPAHPFPPFIGTFALPFLELIPLLLLHIKTEQKG